MVETRCNTSARAGKSEQASLCHEAVHAHSEPPDNPWPNRVIIHLDLDAFFAQVEALDDPSLRGKPVVVGARRRPDGTIGRGVVSTASYEARRFGVHSAMPLARAERLCPHAVFLPARFDRYRELATRVFDVGAAFSPAITRTGIDEGYLDVTGQQRWLASVLRSESRERRSESEKHETPGDDLRLSAPRFPLSTFDLHWPTLLAQRLQRAVLDATGLTCSLGVAPTHFLAKIASDQNKPNGITIVPPADAPSFIASLPISALRGVGPVTAAHLISRGYRTGADLVNDTRAHVHELLGDFGARLWDAAHAIDVGRRHEGFAVSGGDDRHSISHETTFPEDTRDRALLLATLADLTARVAYRLRTKRLRAGCVSIKLRFSDFTTLTRDRSLTDAAAGAIRFSDNESDLLPVARSLLDTLLPARGSTHASPRAPVCGALPRPVRLIGVRATHLSPHADRQLRLDETADFERHTALTRAADAIRARHGYTAITTAHAAERPRRRKRST